jgi:hypothetical protein
MWIRAPSIIHTDILPVQGVVKKSEKKAEKNKESGRQPGQG